MMEYLTLLLPILWAIVSTTIGLLLYKSSRAVIEDLVVDEDRRSKIRLTGSFAIAILAFFAMKSATPETRLQSIPPGYVAVEKSILTTIARGSQQISRSALNLAAATSVGDMIAAQEATRIITLEAAALLHVASEAANTDARK